MSQKILVLDDEENYAEMLESLLEQHFFVVDSATRPELALKALEQKGYDLVISDYKMPVMDGADFLQKAREINPDLPFIIVSGLMNTPELVKVANMGVTLVLEKPIDIENFISQVKTFVLPLSEEEYANTRSSDEGGPSQGLDSRKFIKTYPDTCRYVSDISLTMQFFLQDLWDSLQEQNHVFVRTPLGAEAELVLQEVNHWKSVQGVDPLMLFAAAPTGKASADLKAYCGGEQRAPIVGITGFTEATKECQESLVDAIREAPEEFTFLYFIEESLLQEGSSQINSELYELIKESLCLFPPLVMRPSDLAAYLMRYLPCIAKAEGMEPAAGFEPEAVKTLLAYGWAGNFAELIAVLRAATFECSGATITQDTLLPLLNPSGQDAFQLGERLQAAQAELLTASLGESGGSLQSYLENSGFDTSKMSADAQPHSIPLLFPDLVSPLEE